MTSKGSPDSPGARPKLSPEEVAAVALELLDAEGLEALSMRRLATRLGIGTMTLYGYFRNKEELLDAVLDAAVADSDAVELTGPWQDQLRELMHAARRSIARHPALVKVRAERPVLRPEALRFAELGVGILRGAGFGREDAAHGFRLLFTYVFGYVSFSPEESADEARRRARVAMAELPPEQYTALHDSAAQLADAMAGQAPFEFGLDRIVDGLSAHLERLRGD